VSAGGKRATFGELAADAAKQAVPSEVKLKDPKDFVLIGKPAVRTDARAKSNGTAIFTQDVKLPGLLTAVVLHPPRFGAKLKSFDATKAKQVKGVEQVVAFSTPATNGVAVLAKDYWSAKKGRDALTAEWDESAAFRLGSAEIMNEYKSLAGKPGLSARKDGDDRRRLEDARAHHHAHHQQHPVGHRQQRPGRRVRACLHCSFCAVHG
jgi:isoquinoline 1-oxidoreductase beta subunit